MHSGTGRRAFRFVIRIQNDGRYYSCQIANRNEWTSCICECQPPYREQESRKWRSPRRFGRREGGCFNGAGPHTAQHHLRARGRPGLGRRRLQRPLQHLHAAHRPFRVRGRPHEPLLRAASVQPVSSRHHDRPIPNCVRAAGEPLQYAFELVDATRGESAAATRPGLRLDNPPSSPTPTTPPPFVVVACFRPFPRRRT